MSQLRDMLESVYHFMKIHPPERFISKEQIEQLLAVAGDLSDCILDDFRQSHGRFLIAGSYPSVLVKDLKSFTDIDVYLNGYGRGLDRLLSGRAPISCYQDYETQQRMSFATARILLRDVSGYNVPVSELVHFQTAYVNKHYDDEAKLKKKAIILRFSFLNIIIMPYIPDTRINFGHRVVSDFGHSVTRWVIEYMPPSDNYYLHEESVERKVSLCLDNAWFAPTKETQKLRKYAEYIDIRMDEHAKRNVFYPAFERLWEIRDRRVVDGYPIKHKNNIADDRVYQPNPLWTLAFLRLKNSLCIFHRIEGAGIKLPPQRTLHPSDMRTVLNTSRESTVQLNHRESNA